MGREFKMLVRKWLFLRLDDSFSIRRHQARSPAALRPLVCSFSADPFGRRCSLIDRVCNRLPSDGRIEETLDYARRPGLPNSLSTYSTSVFEPENQE